MVKQFGHGVQRSTKLCQRIVIKISTNTGGYLGLFDRKNGESGEGIKFCSEWKCIYVSMEYT